MQRIGRVDRRMNPGVEKRLVADHPEVASSRGKAEKHIKNSYLKRVDAPVGVKPALRCRMELNEG
jgi:hypothetical protein